MKARVTLTKKANGRHYLGMNDDAGRALVAMVRCAKHYGWETNCMGWQQPQAVRDAGAGIFKAALVLEQKLPQQEA